MLRKLPTALLGVSLLAACTNDDEPGPPAPSQPDAIGFSQANLYPEGVQYDASGKRFLVSSLTTGAVGQVKDDGTYALFADNAALLSSVGMSLDDSRNRLLVAVSDPGYNAQRTSSNSRGKLARLVIFRRDNPAAAPAIVDLGGLRPTAAGHFANDVAVDGQGNAYVTDSFDRVIYKVDVGGTATVFVEDALFAAPVGKFGLNGIVYHPDGYLLVARSDEGSIYKVDLATKAISRVGIAQDLLAADGLRLTDNKTLQVACNAQAKVYRLSSVNGWGAATVSGTFSTPPQYPTTLASREGTDGYVLYSNLNALQNQQTPPVSVFTIARLKF